MHTDKRIDENYSPRTAIFPRLIIEDLSEKTYQRRLRLVSRWFRGGELVGGETPWWRGDRIPSEITECVR